MPILFDLQEVRVAGTERSTITCIATARFDLTITKMQRPCSPISGPKLNQCSGKKA